MKAILLSIALATLALGLVAACGGGPSIPDDVEYTIIQDLPRPQFDNRLVKVSLNKKVSEETLTAIAQEVRNKNAGVERIMIGYYVRGMDTERASWATSHFTPDLDIEILGLTPKEETELLANPLPDNHEVIGRWISDQATALSGFLTVYVSQDTPYLQRLLKDGSTMTSELMEASIRSGRRFNNLSFGNGNEYMIIESGVDGKLRYFTSSGLFEVARRTR